MKRFAVLLLLGSTIGWATAQLPCQAEARSVTPPPASLGLSPFYAKYVDAHGIPVVASANVADAALVDAADLADRMLVMRPDARRRLIMKHVRIGIIGAHEQTTDLPEYRDLYAVFPQTDWNKRTRGVGATVARPVSSVGEENLLQLWNDRYRGESIFIHEFAHSIAEIGIIPADPDFNASLDAAYAHAMAKGLWQNSYSAKNEKEYWAEGAECWFDANRGPTRRHHTVKNGITRRDQLKAYDPELAAVLARVFPDDAWRYKLRYAR